MGRERTINDTEETPSPEDIRVEEGSFEEHELLRLRAALNAVNEKLYGGVTGLHLIAEKELLEKLLEILKQYCAEEDPEQKELLMRDYTDLDPGVEFLRKEQWNQIRNRKIRAASEKSMLAEGNDTVH